MKNHQIEAITNTLVECVLLVEWAMDGISKFVESGECTYDEAVERLIKPHITDFEKWLDMLNDWVADNMQSSKDKGARYFLLRSAVCADMLEELLCDIAEKAPQTASMFKKMRYLLSSIISKMRYLGLVQTTQPQQQNERRHFFPRYNEVFYTSIFNQLKERGYFDNTATLESWLYVCGVGDKKTVENGNFTPLNWVKIYGALSCVIQKIFYTKGDCKWLIAKKCFMKQGKEININSLKNSIPSNKVETEITRMILNAGAKE